MDGLWGVAEHEATQDARGLRVRVPRRGAGACGSLKIGGVYKRSIVNILRALAAKSRNAALMFETCSNLSRLIAKLRMQASVRGVLPLRARQRSSS